MFKDPVTEQFRIKNGEGSFSTVFTLAYPSQTKCIILGLIGKAITKEQRTKIMTHVRERGRKEIIYYRLKNGIEIEKKINL